MNAAGDYSAAYCIIHSDSTHAGHGMVRLHIIKPNRKSRHQLTLLRIDLHHRPRKRNRLPGHFPPRPARSRKGARRPNQRLGQDVAISRLRQPTTMDRAREGCYPSRARRGCQRPLGSVGEDARQAGLEDRR